MWQSNDSGLFCYLLLDSSSSQLRELEPESSQGLPSLPLGTYFHVVTAKRVPQFPQISPHYPWPALPFALPSKRLADSRRGLSNPVGTSHQFRPAPNGLPRPARSRP